MNARPCLQTDFLHRNTFNFESPFRCEYDAICVEQTDSGLLIVFVCPTDAKKYDDKVGTFFKNKGPHTYEIGLYDEMVSKVTFLQKLKLIPSNLAQKLLNTAEDTNVCLFKIRKVEHFLFFSWRLLPTKIAHFEEPSRGFRSTFSKKSGDFVSDLTSTILTFCGQFS